MTTTVQPIPERLKQLSKLQVYAGSHPAPPNGEPKGCTNELISWVAGLPWSDHPECTDSRLSDLIIAVTDGITDDEKRTAYMRKVIPLAINTAEREEEITALLNRLAVQRLKQECLPLADSWPESVRDEVVAAIKQTIEALGGDGDLSAAQSAQSARWSAQSAAWSAQSARSAAQSARSARSAAWSAESAARSAESAARSAEWSARWSAWSARWSAWSARWSAWSAARSAESAAMEREAQRLITELEVLQPPGEAE